jgi:hypothetical protein
LAAGIYRRARAAVAGGGAAAAAAAAAEGGMARHGGGILHKYRDLIEEFHTVNLDSWWCL